MTVHSSCDVWSMKWKDAPETCCWLDGEGLDIAAPDEFWFHELDQLCPSCVHNQALDLCPHHDPDDGEGIYEGFCEGPQRSLIGVREVEVE